MPQTIAEQILSRAAGRTVEAGDLIVVAPDLVMTHDSLTPSIIRIMKEDLGIERVFDPSRVAPDESKTLADFAQQSGARGVLVKTRAPHDLVEALECVLAGGTFFRTSAGTAKLMHGR